MDAYADDRAPEQPTRGLFENTGTNTSNDGYTTASVIQIRLDTAPMLDSIEAFLRGKRIIGYEELENGMTRPRYGASGKAKANEEGIQSIMSWLVLMFSPHAVQGNFGDRNELNEFLCYVQKGLAKYIMSNRLDWGVSRQDYSGIVRGIMVLAEPYFSRLIENKERESYAATMKVSETNRFAEPTSDGIMGILKGGR